MGHVVGGTFYQFVSSLALTAWQYSCFEDLEEEDELVT